jgi:hypothetical protein
MPTIADSKNGGSTVARSAEVVDSLRLGLLVAYLQGELYARAVAATGFIVTTDAAVFGALNTQQAQQVSGLASLITARGGPALAKPTFNFTAKGALPGFAFAAGQYETFRILAQAFEDLAVRAYKGQIQAVVADKTALNAMLAIHSVEARHAAEVRRLRGKKGWITGASSDDVPAFLQAIYAGEDVTTQGTVNVAAAIATSGGAEAASQAFDEPLSAAQVTALVNLFIA